MSENPELIDTHAHLNFTIFNKNREEVTQRCLKHNIWVINVGSNLISSKKAVEIIEKGIYASIGLHPINLDTGLVKIKADEKEGQFLEKDFDHNAYKQLALNKGVVAIGEIGLDHYWRPKTSKKKDLFKQKQKELFLKQLSLAKEINLPVILHCRMAHQDLMQIFKENKDLIPEKAVAHSFVGSLEDLNDFLQLGFHIGFNGIIYKNIEGIDFEKLIKNTPLNKLLVETDCPYLSPLEFKQKRNEPVAVKYIARKIAEIKKISYEDLAKATTNNARELFSI